MTIVIIVNDFPSLSETFISNKVKFLALRGHQLHVICRDKNSLLFDELFRDIKSVSVHPFKKKKILSFLLTHPFLLLGSLKGKSIWLQTLFSQFRIYSINKFKPHIVHFEFSGIGTDYLNHLHLIEGKKVVSCRGSAEKVKLLVYNERKQKFKTLLQLIDAVHCVSADMRQTIAPYCNDIQKVFINFPSIDPSYFKRDRSKKKTSFKMILSVGRMTFQKGYILGLLAIKQLKQTGIDFRWIIAGSGPKYEEILITVHQLDLHKEVILLGPLPREEIKKLMEEADVFFLPSVYEGIANVVLEAMSMELPVVATKSGGMEEVIENGVDGFLAEIADYRLLADHINTLLKDETLCTNMGAKSRKKIIDQFNIERQITKFEEVYTQLLNAQFLQSA